MRMPSLGNSLKIRDKLIIYFIFLIILPITVIFLITYVSLSEFVKNKISNYSSVIVREVCENADEALASTAQAKYFILSNDRIREILTKASSDEVDFNQDSIAMKGYMLNILGNKDYFNSITIFNNNGGRFFETKVPADEPYFVENIYSDSFFNKMREANGQIVWNEYDKKRNTYTAGMQILSSENLQGIGFMVINFDMDEMGRIFARSRVEKAGNFYIVNGQNNIIFHTDKEKIGQDADNQFIYTLNSSKSHVFSRTLTSGKNVIISYSSKEVDWRYVYEISEKDMMREIFAIRNFMIFVFSGGVILSVIFAIIMSFGITRPIMQLMTQMKKAEKGNLDVRVKIKTRDEIGQLGDKFNNMIANIQNLINTVYKEELLRKNAEFEALQAQINPHFMYNTLDSINALAELKGVDEISKITIAFSKLLRASISNNKNIVTLREELSYISNYMTIINIRHNNRIKFINNLCEDTMKFELPKLIIQPLVENSIIHGLEDKLDGCEVELKSWIENDTLFIQVRDNGVGMDVSELESRLQSAAKSRRGSGVGLNNVKKRIELMYGSKYGMDIQSKPNEGAAITLRLPVQLQ